MITVAATISLLVVAQHTDTSHPSAQKAETRVASDAFWVGVACLHVDIVQ